ncbi:MAG: dihydropteroate synthase [Solirubrobacteraceae bacterium]|nr:dihydropteroate synthase [Solirubrobacteraceae bacterium]
MGIVNASPESFSDGDRIGDRTQQVARAATLLAEGADVIDVGGESGVTGQPAIDPSEEISRVVPVIERIVKELGAVVSVDTYKPAVAEAAIRAGASIVNDVSGLLDPELADLCADTGAALVVMHTRTPPKVKLTDPDHYDDVVQDVIDFFEERIELATDRGVNIEQLMLDPGPDFAKTPHQTVATLRALGVLHEKFARPLLLAVSRKDFIGAVTGRPPRERDAGTLAALGEAADAGAHMVRLHDVRAASDFLAVRAVLRGEREIPRDLLLDPSLRRQAQPPRGS